MGRADERAWLAGKADSLNVGVWGCSVTLYYRAGRGSPIWIRWWEGKEKRLVQFSLARFAGYQMRDPERALQLAKEAVANRQRDRENTSAVRRILGELPTITLEALYQEFFANAGWSDATRRNNEVYRRFWLKRLGAETYIEQIANDVVGVERIVTGLEKKYDSPNTVRNYCRSLYEAFDYAISLRWLNPEHELVKLKNRTPDQEAAGKWKAYTREECAKLLPKLEELDLRVALVCWLGVTAGRRAGVCTSLRTSAYEVRDGKGYLTFPKGARTKSPHEREVELIPNVHNIVRRLLSKPAVQATGLFCPSGDVESDERGRRPMDKKARNALIRQAEYEAGVEQRPGRLVHGFKHRYVTDWNNSVYGRAAAYVSDTSRRIFDSNYDKSATKDDAVGMAERRAFVGAVAELWDGLLDQGAA